MFLVFNALIFCTLVALLLRWLVEFKLEGMNVGYLKENADQLPDRYEGVFSREVVEKSVDYTLAKTRFSRQESLFDHVWLAILLVFGLIPTLYLMFTGWIGTGLFSHALILMGISFVLSLPALPFDYWNQFRLEERFGFNRTSPGLWISDKVKGLVLSLLLGTPLLMLLFWIMLSLPQTWWLWGFIVFFGFQLLMVVLYPMLILPWFNKLTPLPEGSLRTRLMDLADRTGFQAKTIQVIDGSRRSSHSNAYFTGFGKFRRIVLYDTLIEQLTEEELEAVLAHEIGHYRLGHIPKLLMISALSGLAAFFFIHLLTTVDGFITAFGFPPADAGTLERMVPALMLFMVLSGLLTYWISPVMNALSRRHEYEADAFALKSVHSPEPLISALRRLHEKNLSNPLPHPAYSAFHYSHPTLLERENALRTSAAA